MIRDALRDPQVLLSELSGRSFVVFDLDGTAYDTRDFERPALAAVAAWVRERSGLALEDLTQALWERRESDRHRPGLFNELLVQRGLPQAWGRECFLRFRAHPGVELRRSQSLFQQLVTLKERGSRLALVSNGYAPVQRKKVAQLGMSDIFDHSVYCDPGNPMQLKPLPWGWSELAPWLAGRQAVYVGDDLVDKEFARAGAAGFIPFSFRSSRYED